MDGIVRRGLSRRQGALVLLLGSLLLLLATRGAAREQPALPHPAPHGDAGLSVMTYNVEGLPWPARFGRGDALARIGERLAALRATGAQPRVVLLQEAFSDDAKAIRAASGHRYAAFGPDDALAGPPTRSPADRAFAAEASFLKGERSGKLLDSGLVILSDYPILSVRRAAFPAAACAGYDCLANKGMVMAVVAVPGAPGPIAVVNLHLNSKRASGVAIERADAAFRQQVAALDRFLAANHVPGMPMIVGGDFNIGRSAARRTMVMEVLARHHGTAPADALSACTGVCRDGLSADAREARRRAKDWQFLIPGAAADLTVRRIATPFGREADGSMLSDHVGYTAYLTMAANPA
ncbi:sphingomyelin phosphodiesterase [Rhizorhabdus wittichii]|uniref:sphingomyelin phosphodiesterase n=1 Tax=Rhizorhabdus wittichii TaxID=160791 RepID=UPI0002E351C3|nr:sphingomyelin phosphodiesterase [Rhizorhabdus wittichii]